MKNKVLTSIFVGIVLVYGSLSWSAIPKYTPSFKKQGLYVKEGVFSGGSTGKGFSLMDLRRKVSKKTRRDRWIMEIGDIYLKPNKGDVPYFHVGVSEDPARIDIDLYQVHRSQLKEEQLRNILSASPYVQSVSMIYDTVEGGMTFSVQLKHPVEVEVFKMKAGAKSSRLVFDLIPVR
tara:strand:- start:79295 stop:79825 length:531 start_codon:yes stop_codon:yes gene_type:complete